MVVFAFLKSLFIYLNAKIKTYLENVIYISCSNHKNKLYLFICSSSSSVIFIFDGAVACNRSFCICYKLSNKMVLRISFFNAFIALARFFLPFFQTSMSKCASQISNYPLHNILFW